jgi:hypothetical protein
VLTGARGTVQLLEPAASSPTEARPCCTLNRLYVGGSVPCETARALASRLDLRVSQVGKLLDFLHIKVRRCGLGCFK